MAIHATSINISPADCKWQSIDETGANQTIWTIMGWKERKKFNHDKRPMSDTYIHKGQLISKGLFSVFNSSKERTWKFECLP